MELAIQNNLVVFAVSEIGKESYKEGQTIASTRGSFRVAYNANKILGVTASRNSDGLLKEVKVKTIANRERESLELKLSVNNVTLVENTLSKEDVKPSMAKAEDFIEDSLI